MLPPRIELRNFGQSLSFSLDSRDTSNFGLPVYNLRPQNSGETLDFISPLHLADLTNHLGSDYILSARLDSGSRSEIDALQAMGFRIFETTLHPRLELGEGSKYFEQDRVQIEIASPSEIAELEEIARSAFKISRFHRDPSVSDSSADERFAGWVRSSHLDPLKNVYVFRLDGSGAIAGFFIVRREGYHSFWELTAIASDYRGKGIARTVWESFVAMDAADGMKVIETNISSENVAVVGLYPRQGFSFSGSSQVLHYHSSWMTRSE